MSKKASDDSFVELYVAFRTALFEFIDPKKQAKFEREFAKDCKFVNDVIAEIDEDLAASLLTDLIVYEDRGEPDFCYRVDDALSTYRRFLGVSELWTALWGFHGKYKGVTKKFVANRKAIRKAVAAQEVAALAALVTIDVDPEDGIIKVHVKGETSDEPFSDEINVDPDAELAPSPGVKDVQLPPDVVAPPPVSDAEPDSGPAAEAAPAP